MKNISYFLLLGFLVVAPLYSFCQTPESRLDSMGLSLPEVSIPSANFVKWKLVGNLLFLSGNGPDVFGKVGKDLTAEEGYAAARETGLEIIAVLQKATGDLSRIKQFVKVLGMVNSDPNFTAHPQVINGFSDLMVAVFGENGKHARSAVGVAALPNNMAVEIEVIVELKD